jgi:hypothetical protein
MVTQIQILFRLCYAFMWLNVVSFNSLYDIIQDKSLQESSKQLKR